MIRAVIFLVVLSMSAAAHSADPKGKFTILSMGTNSCGDVVADFKQDGRGKLNNSIWVAGYLTAINERISTNSNIAAGTNPEAWDLWIFNYCSANPLDTLHGATAALVRELSKRKR